MKKLLLLCIFGITNLGYSIDRFHTDAEKTEQLLESLNEKLEEVKKELQEINNSHCRFIDLLNEMNVVVQQHKTETWDQN